MAIFARLHDLYSFPGFVPAATVRGLFGDPYAVVLSLLRHRKKHPAVYAGYRIAPSTINLSDKCATSIVAVGVSIWSSLSVASSVATATP